MNPSYFRIQLPIDSAKSRLCKLVGVEALNGLVETDSGRAVQLACNPDGEWRGEALFFYHNDGWTVFEDLTGAFAGRPAEYWKEFAGTDSFVSAGYNDSLPYGELVIIDGGKTIREFLHCPDESEMNRNSGRLSTEADDPILTWIEVASFVDEDDLAFSNRGWLWVNEKA